MPQQQDQTLKCYQIRTEYGKKGGMDWYNRPGVKIATRVPQKDNRHNDPMYDLILVIEF